MIGCYEFMGSIKKFKKKLAKYLSRDSLSTSNALSFILKETRKAASLQSCMLTDETGLVIAEAMHRRDSKEHLAATASLISSTCNRISDYLLTSPIKVAFFISNSHLLWFAPITLKKNDKQYLLILIKPKTIFDSFTKDTLQLLEKDKVNVSSIIAIAAQWISKICS